MKLAFTIYGRIPSKKNSRISTRSGRTFPSKQYTAWHKDASKQLLGIKPIEANTPITFVIYPPDNRSGDLSNKFQSIEDLMKDVGIIEDDNWYVLSDIHMMFGEVDKKNPRCCIYIEE
jgi:Holliday junction resolvase RusA-like endonuclease